MTDVGRKTDEALRELRRLGYDGLTIGVETGYDPALHFMDKGYQARDIVEQAHRLDEAGIAYHFSIWPELPGPDAERRQPWPARRCSTRPTPASWAAPC